MPRMVEECTAQTITGVPILPPLHGFPTDTGPCLAAPPGSQGPAGGGQHTRGWALREGLGLGPGRWAQARLGQPSWAGCCPPALGASLSPPARVLAPANDRPVDGVLPAGGALGPLRSWVEALPAPPGPPAPPTTPASVWHPLAQPLRPPADSGHCWRILVHLEGGQPSWGRLGWGWG